MAVRRLAALMAVEAMTLVVASALHLSEAGDGAGVAEAVIAAVLAAGAIALARDGSSVATATVVFAIAGFVVGLSVTADGGAVGDLAYHATMLPILLATLVLLARATRQAR